MSLEEFGAKSHASLREIVKDEEGDVVCPVSQIPIGYSRGEIEIPVARLVDEELQETLDAAGVEYLRGHGYTSPKYDLLLPEEVTGPEATGWSDRMVGVRVDLAAKTIWTPVRADDLEPADRALELVHVSGAAADGSGGTTTAEGPGQSPGGHSGDVSAPTRPAVVEQLDLPTTYPDGHPRNTYVGHAQRDEVDVYAGRHGEGGSKNFITSEEIGEAGWLGNPYPADAFGREEAVEMFLEAFLVELEQRPELRRALYEQVRGRVLGCWCHGLEETGPDAPLCHADVIAWIADRVIRPVQGGEADAE